MRIGSQSHENRREKEGMGDKFFGGKNKNNTRISLIANGQCFHFYLYSLEILLRNIHDSVGYSGRLRGRKSSGWVVKMIKLSISGIIFVDGPLWKDHRKFSVASLRHLGMVKTEIGRRAQLEERIMRQVRQLLKVKRSFYDNFINRPLNTFLLPFRQSKTLKDMTWIWPP